MAVEKRLDKQTFTMRVPNGYDGHDNVKYKDMTITGINRDASTESLVEMGESLGTLMNKPPQIYLMTETHRLVKTEA